MPVLGDPLGQPSAERGQGVRVRGVAGEAPGLSRVAHVVEEGAGLTVASPLADQLEATAHERGVEGAREAVGLALADPLPLLVRGPRAQVAAAQPRVGLEADRGPNRRDHVEELHPVPAASLQSGAAQD